MGTAMGKMPIVLLSCHLQSKMGDGYETKDYSLFIISGKELQEENGLIRVIRCRTEKKSK